MAKSTDDMLSINVEQASFYDSISEAEDRRAGTSGYSSNRSANFFTRSWAALRGRQKKAVLMSGVADAERVFQDKCLDTKRGGDFLEIGCFRGSKVGLKMIEASSSYVGVELSPKAAEVYRSKIAAAGLTFKAEVIAGDFLKLPTDKKFDLIYAHGVLHHFANPEPVFEKIASLLKPDGILLFTEPSARNPMFRMARSLYRPFQSDKAWEWPFSKKTLELLHRYLTPVDGFGWGKISLPLSVFVGLPVLHHIVFPIYIRAIKHEVESGWERGVWNNSSVVATYKRKHS